MNDVARLMPVGLAGHGSGPAPTARDTRIDALRGLALVTIFINHVPGTVFEHLTHRNFGFSDAAELFVLLAGMAAAWAYFTPWEEGRRLAVTVKAWRRAGTLYVVHITTSVLALAVVAVLAVGWGDAAVLDGINGRVFRDDPLRALVGLAGLGHQLGYFNILPLYAAILVAVPLILALARAGLAVLLAASLALWAAASAWGLNLPNYPRPGGWFFNPLAWQVLFAIGLAGAIAMRRGWRPPGHPLLVAAAVAYLGFALLFVRGGWWGLEQATGLPAGLVGFDKTYVAPARLLHILALAYVFAATGWLNRLLQVAPDHPLALMGRHALPVFATGSVLAVAALAVKAVASPSWLLDAALLSAGLAAQVAVAVAAARLRPVKGAGRGSAPTPPHPCGRLSVDVPRGVAGIADLSDRRRRG